jgi:hypothetical protein
MSTITMKDDRSRGQRKLIWYLLLFPAGPDPDSMRFVRSLCFCGAVY